MKRLVIFLILVIPGTGFAQNPMEMNQADLDKMMQQMEKMQSCLENIDESELKALEKRTQKMEGEVQSLCASGERDAAQDKALAYGKEIRNDPVTKMLAKCGAMMKGAMPDVSFSHLEKAGAEYHICD